VGRKGKKKEVRTKAKTLQMGRFDRGEEKVRAYLGAVYGGEGGSQSKRDSALLFTEHRPNNVQPKTQKTEGVTGIRVPREESQRNGHGSAGKPATNPEP